MEVLGCRIEYGGRGDEQEYGKTDPQDSGEICSLQSSGYVSYHIKKLKWQAIGYQPPAFSKKEKNSTLKAYELASMMLKCGGKMVVCQVEGIWYGIVR